MNRRKKIKSILTKRSKQANLKANPKKAKPKYISKAERETLAAEDVTTSEQPSSAVNDDTNEELPPQT